MTPERPSPHPTPRRLRPVLLLGLGAAVLGLLGWALGWLAAEFGYQSNDANLPVVLTLSALVFTALLLAISSTPAGKGTRKRLRRWWRG